MEKRESCTTDTERRYNLHYYSEDQRENTFQNGTILQLVHTNGVQQYEDMLGYVVTIPNQPNLSDDQHMYSVAEPGNLG